MPNYNPFIPTPKLTKCVEIWHRTWAELDLKFVTWSYNGHGHLFKKKKKANPTLPIKAALTVVVVGWVVDAFQMPGITSHGLVIAKLVAWAFPYLTPFVYIFFHTIFFLLLSLNTLYSLSLIRCPYAKWTPMVLSHFFISKSQIEFIGAFRSISYLIIDIIWMLTWDDSLETCSS